MNSESERPAPTPSTAPPSRPKLSGCGVLSIAAALCALIVVASLFGVPWFMALGGARLLHRAENAFGSVLRLTPITTIKGDSVVLEKSAIAELAVAQRKSQIVMKYETQWLSSTKILVVRADFIVKAGFDLNHVFRFTLTRPDPRVLVELPKPVILDVALQNYEIIFSSDGIINKLQPADQERVVNLLLAKARDDAARSDLATEAQQQIEQRLRDLLSDSGAEVTVRFAEPRKAPPEPPPGA